MTGGQAGKSPFALLLLEPQLLLTG
jgi:hypothetical protein